MCVFAIRYVVKDVTHVLSDWMGPLLPFLFGFDPH